MNFFEIKSNFFYTEGNKYRFLLLEDLILEFKNYNFTPSTFYDSNNKLRLELNKNILKIYSKYSWDGCSPKYSIGDYWIGTPDYPETIMPSLVHDTLWQFLHSPCLKLSMKDTNIIFYKMMKQNNFKFAYIYYKAVDIFGSTFYSLGKRQKISCVSEF